MKGTNKTRLAELRKLATFCKGTDGTTDVILELFGEIDRLQAIVDATYNKTAVGRLRCALLNLYWEICKAMRPRSIPILDFLARLLPPYRKGKP